MTTPRINNQLDTPDTSREAVEALAKTDREKFVMMGPRYLMMRIEEMADVLRALLDERDALKAERDAARRAALEEALNAIDQAEDADFILDRSEARGYRKSYEAIRSLADKEG